VCGGEFECGLQGELLVVAALVDEVPGLVEVATERPGIECKGTLKVRGLLGRVVGRAGEVVLEIGEVDGEPVRIEPIGASGAVVSDEPVLLRPDEFGERAAGLADVGCAYVAGLGDGRVGSDDYGEAAGTEGDGSVPWNDIVFNSGIAVYTAGACLLNAWMCVFGLTASGASSGVYNCPTGSTTCLAQNYIQLTVVGLAGYGLGRAWAAANNKNGKSS
jgi:hypothetical protein